MNKPYLLLAFGLMLSACSVKEDRTSCPCLLNIITTEAFAPLNDDPEDGWRLTLTGYAEEGMIVEDCFGKEGLRDTLEYPVKKGSVVLAARLADTERPAPERYCLVPFGEQAPRLYACSGRIDASGETVYFPVQPHKQFTTITLLDDSGTDNPFGGRTPYVRGQSGGLDLTTLQPVRGAFECRAEPVDNLPERGFRVRIPRQEDPSLELILEAEGGGPGIRFPIGETLFAQELTPADEEMPDYIVWFTTSVASVRVSSVIIINKWL